MFAVSEFGCETVMKSIMDFLTSLKVAIDRQNDAWSYLYTGLEGLVRVKAYAYASQDSKLFPVKMIPDYINSVVSEFATRIPDMIRNYDPAKSLVSTYAQGYMLRTCLDVAREYMPIQPPRSVQDACNRYMGKMAALPDEGRNFDQRALLSYLGCGPRLLSEVKWWSQCEENVVHIDDITQNDDETPNRELADPRCRVENEMIRKSIVRDVRGAVEAAIRDYGSVLPDLDCDTALALLNKDVSVAGVARRKGWMDVQLYRFLSIVRSVLTVNPILISYCDYVRKDLTYLLHNLQWNSHLKLVDCDEISFEPQECLSNLFDMVCTEPDDITSEF